jgi:hypothetical protein
MDHDRERLPLPSAVQFVRTTVLADADGGTHVRITHTGWPASGFAGEPQWEETFAYFDRAWAGVLRMLVDFAKTGKKVSE